MLGCLARFRTLLCPGTRKPYPLCPECKVPIPGWVGLAKHLRDKHGWKDPSSYSYFRCRCGLVTHKIQKAARHLAGHKDLGWHVTLNTVGGQ